VLRITVLFAFICVSAAAQNPDPAYQPLEKAYQALRQKNYDDAIQGFKQAISIAPDRASIRKDLAYTLLKIGENETARDQFAEAMRIDPADNHVALEYAFLCYETKQQAVARRIFDRIRKTGDATAEQAFQNIDQPLAEGIARWTKALQLSPGNFSAHQELAALAEQRDELKLAAENYEAAWRLRPVERSLMLDLGRVWKLVGREEEANYLLLAASRGAPPRVAEKARELLPEHYPYAYEFEKALELDPKNIELRREFAYFLLQLGKPAEAEPQFLNLHQAAPDDLLTAAQLGFLRLNRGDRDGAQPLLDQVLQGNNQELADRVRVALKVPQASAKPSDTAPEQTSDQAKALAEKSMQAGYLKDALKYLTVAHQQDPADFGVMLKLGWLNNILHDDREAIKWFNLASQSPDKAVSTEAGDAYRNLAPAFERFRTTAWLFPFFSSRWHDAFGYGQIKTEIKLGNLPIHPYLSVRFVGDERGATPSAAGNPPQYLSESSLIFGIGVATTPRYGATGWFEAGTAVNYLASRTDVGAAISDYRGGVSYAKGFGHLLSGAKGLFAENNEDAVFISRFQNDMLFSTQNRLGYTLAPLEGMGGLQAQFYWNINGSADRLRQYWANYVETGPGLRFRFHNLPKSLIFSVNFVRGVYTVNDFNPRRPNYYDLRVGFWYAITR